MKNNVALVFVTMVSTLVLILYVMALILVGTHITTFRNNVIIMEIFVAVYLGFTYYVVTYLYPKKHRGEINE